jgi:hypothetical protein
MQYSVSLRMILPPATGITAWASWQSVQMGEAPSFSFVSRSAWTDFALIWSGV